MACHDDGLPVAQTGSTFADADVYKVSAVTGEVNDDGTIQNVRLDLNCDEMREVYAASCARAMTTFDEFHQQVNTEANIAASVVYPDAAALNDSWETNPAGQRINNIRICIRWRWLRIYIIWHI